LANVILFLIATLYVKVCSLLHNLQDCFSSLLFHIIFGSFENKMAELRSMYHYWNHAFCLRISELYNFMGLLFKSWCFYTIIYTVF